MITRPSKNKVQQNGGYTSTHKAYDFDEEPDPNAYACMDCEVVQSADRYVNSWHSEPPLTTRDYGNYIKFLHVDGTFSIYAHLAQDRIPKVGEKFKAGERVATIGNTGNSTGPHLHFEFRDQDNHNQKVEFQEVTMPTQEQLDECMKDREVFWKERDELAVKLESCQTASRKKDTDRRDFLESVRNLFGIEEKLVTFQEGLSALNRFKTPVVVVEPDTTNLQLEALKEPLRILALGVVSTLVTVLVGVLTDLPTEYQTQTVVILTMVLRGVDKYMHELGKKNDNEILKMGITRF